MSRLQVGGLALIVGFSRVPYNLGKTVKLDKNLGKCLFSDGYQGNDIWVIRSDDLIGSDGNIKDYMYCEAKYLMPLGDDKGIELYGLREELNVTRHDKRDGVKG